MLLSLHGPFLVYLLVALLWNLAVSAPPPGQRAPWERRWLLPLQVVLTALLFIDRLRPAALPLLDRPWAAGLFPLALSLAIVQNLSAVRTRGARLTDIPFLLANTGLLLCTALGTAELAGGRVPPAAAALLYDHSILQHMLGGSSLAHLSSLSWHVPLCAPRRDPQTWPGLIARLIVAALAGFIVLMLGFMVGTAREVLARFEDEPRLLAPRADLQVGIFDDAAAAPALRAFRWRADADEMPVTPHAARGIVIELDMPVAWSRRLPGHDDGPAFLLDAAERVARGVQPEVLLPFPEPDGMGALLLGVRSPAEWRALYESAAQRVAQASPGTRLAVRLVGTGPGSRALFEALAAQPSPVQIAGPRLLPGAPSVGGPAGMDALLDAWAQWRAGVPHSPELWILSAGCSVPAYGELAQARFVEGCFARASARPEVRGLLFDGGLDLGHTMGLLRGDGTPRLAALRLDELLAAQAATR